MRKDDALKTNRKRRLEKYPLKSLSSSRPPFPFQRSHSTKPFSSPSRRSQISNSGFEANYKVQQSQERTKTKDKVTQYNLLLNDTVYSRKFTENSPLDQPERAIEFEQRIPLFIFRAILTNLNFASKLEQEISTNATKASYIFKRSAHHSLTWPVFRYWHHRE